MKEKNYFHGWFLTMNVFQDGTPYDWIPVGNIPELMPLDNSLNGDILHSLRFHCILSRFVLDSKVKYEEDMNVSFIFYKPKETSRGLKCIWE